MDDNNINNQTKKAGAKKLKKRGQETNSGAVKVKLSSESRFFHIICFDRGVMPLDYLSENTDKRDALVLKIKNVMLEDSRLTTVEVLARSGVYINGEMCVECLTNIPSGNRCDSCSFKSGGDTLWSLILSSRREWLSNMESGQAFVNKVNELIASTKDTSGTFVTHPISESEATDTTPESTEQPKPKGWWSVWPFF